MKTPTLILSLLLVALCHSQSLPIDFEGDINTSDFVDFAGGTASVIPNPVSGGINTSENVASIVRDGGEIYAGSKILLSDALDFSVLTKITMKVYSTAPAGTLVKFKLEGAEPTDEVDAFTSTSDEWEVMEWVFITTPENLDEIVFMFDFGNLGDGSETSTFYFDDIEQVEGPAPPVPTTLPVDFESGIVSTDLLSFAGAAANVITNPEPNAANPSATVCEVVKEGGQFWAGSFMYLEDSPDLSTNWQFTMKVFTTAPAGTLIKLELQGPNGAYDADYWTTTSGEWENIGWNFYGQANDFDRFVVMFDYGNIGDGSATSTFLFDDLEQTTGEIIPDPIAAALPIDFENSVVTTDFVSQFGGTATVIPNPQIDAENPSATVAQFLRSGGANWTRSLLQLTEFMDFSTLGSISMRVYTEAPIGTALKLRVETTESEAANELDVLTTVSGEWATYSWDFSGDPPIYNVLTFMFGYGSPNDASPQATFLFDDIQQTNGVLSNNELNSNEIQIKAFPNPSSNQTTISSASVNLQQVVLFDAFGKLVVDLAPNDSHVSISTADLTAGVYLTQVTTASGSKQLRLIIE